MADQVVDIPGDARPIEWLVGKGPVVECAQCLDATELCGQRLEGQVCRMPPIVESVAGAHPTLANHGEELGFEAVDRGHGGVGVHRAHSTLGVGKPHESADQAGNPGELGGRHQHLAGKEVEQSDLDDHRAPPQRVAAPVAGTEPDQGVDQVALDLVEVGGLGGSEKTLDEGLALRLADPGVVVARPTPGHSTQCPLHQGTTDRPGGGFERREEPIADLDRLMEARRGVGAVTDGQSGVGVVRQIAACPRRHGLDGGGEGEGVLDHGAHVVVDVDQDREIIAGAGAHPEQIVLAVAEHVAQRHHLAHRHRIKTFQPQRQGVGTTRQLGGDAVPVPEWPAEGGDGAKQRGGLDRVVAEERLQQLLGVGTADRAAGAEPGIAGDEDPARQQQQVERLLAAEGGTHLVNQ